MPKLGYQRTKLGRFTGKGEHPRGMLGKKQTQCQREMISQKLKGRKITWKDKIGKANSVALKGNKSHLWKDGRSKQPGYDAFRSHRRRERIKGNGGSHTLGEWETLKAQHNWTCFLCKKKEPEIKLTEDHIIPSSKGGSDNIENIQPLCRSCNSKKGNKL